MNKIIEEMNKIKPLPLPTYFFRSMYGRSLVGEFDEIKKLVDLRMDLFFKLKMIEMTIYYIDFNLEWNRKRS